MSTEALRDRLSGRLDELAASVVALAEINSGSYNPAGVDRCGERLAELVAGLAPDTLETIPVAPSPVIAADGTPRTVPVGKALRATKRADAPFTVCFFGHLDTVFGPDDPFQQVTVDGRRLHGPGVADCKGGLVLAMEVLRHLDSVEWGHGIGWEFLVVPDEEIGSVGSKALLGEAGEANDLGIGFEPALPSGNVAAARKGSLNVHTIVRGRAAHVGRAHDEGRSAIRGLAELIVELEALNQRSGVTVNCGRISGGGALNVVPDFAMGSYNLRVESTEDQTWVQDRFVTVADAAVLDVDVIWTSTRPPKARTPELELLLADVADAANGLGIEIAAEDTGGCCDGNDLAAAGLPNVDSLGIFGGGIHSSDEFADIDSIPERAAVVAEVVRRAHERAGS
jgi:glutamate carboxypeptidase